MLIHVKKDGKVIEVVDGAGVSTDYRGAELIIYRTTGWGIFETRTTVAIFKDGTWDCAVPLIPEPVK